MRQCPRVPLCCMRRAISEKRKAWKKIAVTRAPSRRGSLALSASIVNVVIGAGIFNVPSSLAAAVGTYGALAFLACSVAVGAVAICFAEGGQPCADERGHIRVYRGRVRADAGFHRRLPAVVQRCTRVRRHHRGARRRGRERLSADGASGDPRRGDCRRDRRDRLHQYTRRRSRRAPHQRLDVRKTDPARGFRRGRSVRGACRQLRSGCGSHGIGRRRARVDTGAVRFHGHGNGGLCERRGPGSHAHDPAGTSHRDARRDGILRCRAADLPRHTRRLAGRLHGTARRRDGARESRLARVDARRCRRCRCSAGSAAIFSAAPASCLRCRATDCCPSCLADCTRAIALPTLRSASMRRLRSASRSRGPSRNLPCSRRLPSRRSTSGACAAAWFLARRGVALAGTPLSFRWLGVAATIGILSMVFMVSLAAGKEIGGLAAILLASALLYVIRIWWPRLVRRVS